MKNALNIIECMDDLFSDWFKESETWAAWRTCLKAAFSLPMSDDELVIYKDCTGRTDTPTEPISELWLCVGRRSGKSFTTALIAVFLATMRDWSPYLIPGERGVIAIVAVDRKQAKIIFRYVRALLAETPILAPLIEDESKDTIDLTNGISIEIGTNSQRSLRGSTIIASLCDELAHWRSDSNAANPDSEVIDAALRPAMSTVQGSMLICVSSPHARRGMLYDAYRQHWGMDGPILYWKAASRTMNPTLKQSVINAALARDASRGSAEFLAEFRTDVETFISQEVVEAAVISGRYELSPNPGISYRAFVDPSGGSKDAFTLAIGHRDNDRIVVDALRETRPPFSPDGVASAYSELLKRYGLHSTTGDRYAGEWPRERFREHGVVYELAPKPKSELYLSLLPELNSGRVELLDNPQANNELIRLERRTARGGRDSVDHPPNSHDDLANVIAGLVALVATPVEGRRSIPLRM
jgi:hypothetical protein